MKKNFTKKKEVNFPLLCFFISINSNRTVVMLVSFNLLASSVFAYSGQWVMSHNELMTSLVIANIVNTFLSLNSCNFTTELNFL